MADLKDPRLIYFKACLFLLCGLSAVLLLLLRSPFWQTGLLIGLAIWCFCRCYYFAFYVIQHYVDDSYKFAGLIDFVCYVLRRSRTTGDEPNDKQ